MSHHPISRASIRTVTHGTQRSASHDATSESVGCSADLDSGPSRQCSCLKCTRLEWEAAVVGWKVSSRPTLKQWRESIFPSKYLPQEEQLQLTLDGAMHSSPADRRSLSSNLQEGLRPQSQMELAPSDPLLGDTETDLHRSSPHSEERKVLPAVNPHMPGRACPSCARPIKCCLNCGEQFFPNRADALTCSPNCRVQRAYNKKNGLKSFASRGADCGDAT